MVVGGGSLVNITDTIYKLDEGCILVKDATYKLILLDGEKLIKNKPEEINKILQGQAIADLILCGEKGLPKAIRFMEDNGFIDRETNLFGGLYTLYRLAGFCESYKHVVVRGSRRISIADGSIALDAPYGVINGINIYIKGQIIYSMTNTLLDKNAGQSSDSKRVTILSTDDSWIQQMQELIKDGIAEASGGSIEINCFNSEELSVDDFIASVKESGTLIVGSESNNGNFSPDIWKAIVSIPQKYLKDKKCALFYISGAYDTGSERIRAYLDSIGANLNVPAFTLGQALDAESRESICNYGYDLGCIFMNIPNPRRPKYVKCLVCGEIFDASLGICPVCGVGLDQCVPVSEDELLYRNDTQRKYVIVGGGVAAVSAAKEIRNRDNTGSIIVISRENYLPINRPILTKDFSAAKDMEESIFIHDKTWYESNGIELILGEEVEEISTSTKQIKTSSNRNLCYDRLILATGAECFVPPFEGANHKNVVTIRHIEDCQKIYSFLNTAKSVVVIGGGVLGLEAANEFLRMGLKVTILEAAPQIIGRQADGKSAQILKDIIRSMNVEIFEGVNIKSIDASSDDEIKGVRLEDGRLFEADFVVVSCGNRGNLKLAQDIGINIDRSIIVDCHMRTSEKDIFACGDCCQYEGINFQLWQEASSQGKVAGANAAGEKLVYTTPMLGLHMQGFGTTLYAIGDPGKNSELSYKKVCFDDQVGKRHKQYWFHGGTLKGLVTIGCDDEVIEATDQVLMQMEYKHIFDVNSQVSTEKSLAELDSKNLEVVGNGKQ